jgi:phosphate transport system permease protein
MTVRAWPRVVSLVLGLVPVACLGAIVGTLGVRSVPALTDVGWHELTSTKFSSIFLSGVGHYGLLPAAWGTVMVVFLAMIIAFPAAFAMAVFSAELAPRAMSRVMRTILGVLAGIPPIVYALMGVVFVGPFIAPKFTAGFTYSTPDPAKVGVAASDWPPYRVPWNPGAFPWDPSGLNNSLLLAAILLALLAIPFMAPLIDDALRTVPTDRREASLALGASRWWTLMHVTIPHSASGIVAALRIGILKVLGDAIIVLFVVGYAAPQLPNPLWDALERTAPLSAEGVGLIGGFGGPKACSGNDCAVGYFSALILIAMALIVVLATSALQRRFRQRYAP